MQGYIDALRQKIEYISDFSNTLGNLVWLVGGVIVLFICINALLSVKKKANRHTIQQIEKLKKEGKYIPGIFIELNNVKEVIRYFVFGNSKKRKIWIRRIIRMFNQLYDNTNGDILCEAIKIDENVGSRFHFGSLEKIERIKKTIIANCGLHDALMHDRFDGFKGGYEQSGYIFSLCGRTYIEKLNDLKNYSDAVDTNYIILTGSAGNGKTNLLCNVAETIIKNGFVCLFMNARDMSSNPLEYLFECLQPGWYFCKHKRIYFWLIDKILLIRRNRLYITIDAINENESDTFGQDLASMIDNLLCYKRFNVIVSCRNEYFEEKFKSTIQDGVKANSFIVDAKDVTYRDIALDRLFNAYGNYFNFHGVISPYAKHILSQQLLLLRMFFEVYRDSNKTVVNVNRHEVFVKYIKDIQIKVDENIDEMLDTIASAMLELETFSGIELGSIKFTDKQKAALPDILDKSILINKTIKRHENTILENNTEQLYFVFDEMRDYCLSKHILRDCEINDGKIDVASVITVLQNLAENKYPCLEGVLSHTYTFFKSDAAMNAFDKDYVCKEILNNYSSVASEMNDNVKYYRMQEFSDLGIRIIMNSGTALEDFEIEYLYQQLLHGRDWHQIQRFLNLLIESALNQGQYSLENFLNIMYKCVTIDELQSLMRGIFDGVVVHNGIKPDEIIGVFENLLIINAREALMFRKIVMVYYSLFTYENNAKYQAPKEYFRTLPDAKIIWSEVRGHFSY